MRLRRIITVAAVTVTVAAGMAAGMAGQGMADAATSATSAGGPAVSIASVRRVNLHAANERAAANVKTGPIAGIVKPRGARSQVGPSVQSGVAGAGTAVGAGGAVPSASTCTEPNCDLTYHGGPVQHSPKIYVDFWGPLWTTDAGSEASANYLLKFYQGLGSAQDNWSRITSQYKSGSGSAPTFTGSVFAGAFNDTSTPPAQVSEADLGAEATATANSLGISDVANAQIVVATQTGTCLAVGAYGFAGDSSACLTTAGAKSDYCAWHSSTSAGLSFTSLPYQLDAGTHCGENFVNTGSAGTYDGFSVVGGHEYAESITDPEPNVFDYAWIDESDAISGGEVADKCAWGGELWSGSDPYGDVTLSTGSFAMQSLWSNAAGGCVMTGPLSTSLTGSLSGGGRTGKSIWATVGTAVSASVTLSGTNASRATGSVDYFVYSNPACTTLVGSTGPETITTAGKLPAGQQSLTKPGTYYWKATYSGDGYNQSSETACGTNGLVEAVMTAVPSSPGLRGPRSWRPSAPRCWENCSSSASQPVSLPGGFALR